MIIGADYLLARILSSQDSVSYESISKVQRRIEELCPGVAVDASSCAIRSAVRYYPQIFECQDDSIVRAGNAHLYLSGDYVKYEFSSAVPAEVDRQVTQAIQTSFHSS